MTHVRIVADSLEYDFVPDTQPLVAERHWSLFIAQVRDDIGGEPLRRPFTVRVVPPGIPLERDPNGGWVRRTERGILIKQGEDGTFALVARPWVRFNPFGLPANVTVQVEAPGFLPLRHTFVLNYDTRTVAAPAPAAGATTVTLNSNAQLVAGQTLLFGPAASPQYVRLRNVAAGNQVILEAGLEQAQVIGAQVFPDGYRVPPAAQLTLRRAAVRIYGRVVVRDTTANTSTAVPGAVLSVTDFWRTRADVVASPNQGAMANPNPAQRQFLVAVSPGTLAARALGAGAGSVGLPVVGGDDRVLDEPVEAEATRIGVDRGENLVAPPSPLANRLVSIEPGNPDRSEYQTLTGLRLEGSAAEPADVDLSLPLRSAHREGSRVARINAPAVSPPTPRVLRDGTAPGDRCLFLDSLATLPLTGAMRLAGGGAADEYQDFSQFRVAANAEGYYWLPPVQRIARLQITADDGSGNLEVIEVDPEYGEPEQRLDFVYPV